jgi:phosphatidylserine/phosphatidylglycerophosphate/cardiolipin synthase-like enzyme
MSCKVYGPEDQGWRKQCVEEVKSASQVVLVSYMYDAKDIHRALLAELRRRGKKFQCIIVVDRGIHDTGSGCKDERKMVKELREAGAQIYLAHGSHGQGKLSKHCGSCHIKCCLVDNRVAYSGSANFTEAATKNLEMVFRITGPPVAHICQIVKSLLNSETCHRAT